MESYEKAYKEMVQRARELHEGGNALTKLQMEIVCPELAESEDERVNEEIRNFLIDMECKREWIAYLEKQKDIKLLSWRAVDECRDIPDGHYVVVAYNRPGFFALDTVVKGKLSHPRRGDIKATGVFYIPNADENCMCIIEKQKEHKFKEWKPLEESMEALLLAIEGKWDAIKPTGYMSRRLEDLYDGLVNTFNVEEAYLPKTNYTEKDIEELKTLKSKIDASMEQKPAGKQDYSGLTDFERAIHRGFLCAGVENVPVEIIKETAQDCLAHIEQKPAEWSEEDEKIMDEMRETFMRLIGDRPDISPNQKWSAAVNFIDKRLKSLRPQSQWKPSEEQMDALNKMTLGNFLGSGQYDILRTLYEQLKKL